MDTDHSQKPQNWLCPECDTPLNLGKDLKVGKIIECPACSTQSEILSLDPVKLAPLEEEK